MVSRFSLLLTLQLCVAATGLAAVISYSATSSCTGMYLAGEAEGVPIYATVSNSGVSSCRLADPNTGLFSYEIGTELHTLTDGVGATMAWTYGFPYSFVGGFQGETALDVTWRFTSGGAPREGIALLSLGMSEHGFPPFMEAVQILTVTDNVGRTYTFDRFVDGCSDPHQCFWNYDPRFSSPPALPFQLGAPFDIRIQLSSSIPPTLATGEPYGAALGAYAELWLREADGSTHVSISDVPEPRMVLPLLGGLALVWLARRRRARHNRAPISRHIGAMH